MSTPRNLTTLIELLHRALKAQMHYAQDHPQAVQSVEAAQAVVQDLLERNNPLILTCEKGRIWHAGRPVEGAPNAAQSLCREMLARGITGLAFHSGFDQDELQLLLFALQLQPQRLQEMGGPSSLLPEGAGVRIVEALPRNPDEEAEAEELELTAESPEAVASPAAASPAAPAPDPRDSMQIVLDFDELPAAAPARIQAPAPAAGPIVVVGIPLDLPPTVPAAPPLPPPPARPAPAVHAAAALPLLPEPLPEETEPEPPSPAALTADLRSLFAAIVQMTGAPPVPSVRSPWSSEHREVIRDFGFLVPDFSSLVGTGEQLSLGRVDPVTLRDALRAALSALDPMTQGAVLLGLPTFPTQEQALRRALDYLAPELLAVAVAEAHLQRQPSRFELALLVAGLLQCVKDRELSLEAIRGRLQFEGWSLHDVDELKDAILWECHGTDTKLRMSLLDRGVFELDAHQVMVLNRQLLQSKRLDGLKDLLAQLETGFASPEAPRRRHAAEIVADLAECLAEPGLPPDLEQQLFRMLHDHIGKEQDQAAILWSCQAMEALLGHWIRGRAFEAVHKELLNLGEIALNRHPVRSQAVKDLLARLGSPLNMATLGELLHQKEGQAAGSHLQALLAFMGRPAAEFLVASLEQEEDRTRRGRVLAAIRALGRSALVPLKETLASPHWFMVRNAVTLLGEMGHRGVFDDVALALEHRDARVRKAAVAAVAALGEPPRAAAALAEVLPRMDLATQLDILGALAELKEPGAAPAVLELLPVTRSGGEDALRLRLRAVEVLGTLGALEAVEPLRELFKKKGLLGGRESTAVRLAAAKALASINTRESREAVALALDGEPQEEVRALLRQVLVEGAGR